MKFLFASSNQGKINELVSLFSDSDHQIVSINDLEYPSLDVDEVGETFSDNALLKARAYADKYQLATLADDSGLEVISLDNQPGVNSNRWFAGSDQDRNDELLRLMQNSKDRSARFVTVACIYFPETRNCHFFEGTVDGTIATAPRGEDGFGYDPIFIPDGYTQTFAELGVSEKNRLSHRAKAFAQVKKFL